MAAGQSARADVELLLSAICRKFDSAYLANHCARIMASRDRMDWVPNWSASLCCHGDMAHFQAFKDEIERVREAHPIIRSDELTYLEDRFDRSARGATEA